MAGYADDLSLFTKDAKTLLRALIILPDIFTAYGLNMNELKTKTQIVCNRDPEDYPTTLFKLNGSNNTYKTGQAEGVA